MNTIEIEEINRAIQSKYWFGGKAIFPWHHPVNRVANAMLIHLDGSPMCKFKVHKNGKLRLMKIYDKSYLDLKMRPLQTVAVKELLKKINGNTDYYTISNVKKRMNRRISQWINKP